MGGVIFTSHGSLTSAQDANQGNQDGVKYGYQHNQEWNRKTSYGVGRLTFGMLQG